MSLLIIRLLVFVLVFWAGWRLWQYWQGFQNQKLNKNSSSENSSFKNTADPVDHEAMVRCLECGVHLPASQATRSGDQFFCCPEHRERYQDTSDN